MKKDYDKQISTAIINQCTHNNYYYGYHANTNHACTKACALITECYADGKTLLDVTVDSFLLYLSAQPVGYYSNQGCLNKNSACIIPILKELFKDHVPIDKFLMTIIQIRDYDECYIALTNNKDFKLSYDCVNAIIQKRLEFSFNEEDTDLIDFLMQHIEITYDMLLSLSKCRNGYLAFLLSSIVDKYTSEDELDKEMLYAAVETLPYSKPIVNSLINRGVGLDDHCLDIVCAKCDIDAIGYILETGRIPILKEHYKSLVTSKEAHRYQNMHHYHYRSVNPNHQWDKGYSMEKMELLIKYGYKPDYEDIVYGVQHKAEIPGIDRFDIILDQKLLDICWDNDFYPQYKFDCIEQSMVELQKLCKTRKAADIKKHMKAYKLVPDRKCMENACAFKNNNAIVKYLLENGGKITLKCLKNCSEEFGANMFLQTIIQEYEKIVVAEQKGYTDKIEMLTNKVKELGGTIEETIPEPAKKIIIDTISDETEDMEEEEEEEEIEEEEEVEEVGDTADSENGEYIICKGKKKPNTKKPTKKSGKKTADIPDIPKILIDINIAQDKMVTIQNQNRTKKVVPSKFMEIFKLEDKQAKMSYSDIKKYIITKIRNNNWIDPNNKNLFNLPEDMKDKLGLQKEGYVNFTDIDKITCLFYN